MPETEIEDQTAQNDGGLEVEIADAAGNGASAADKVAAAVDKVAAAPQPSVEDLQRQLKSMEERESAALRERSNMERIARDQAEALARAQDETARARGEATDQRRGSIEASIVASQAAADMARRDYQLALEAGDFQKASEANAKQIEAAAELANLKIRKIDDVAQRSTQQQYEQRQPSRANPSVDAYIQTKTPRTQVWLQAHPETVTDPRLNNKTVAAHYEALADGYTPDTDQYFEYIDRKLGFAGAVANDDPADPPIDTSARKRAEQRVSTPPAAPSSRDSARGESSGRMYLSRGELETAESLGITPSEYGKRKAAMQKAGYYHS